MKLGQLVFAGSKQLETAGVQSPVVDAELLAAHVLGISRGELQTKIIIDEEVSNEQVEHISELLAKRAERIPLQHLTGVAHFRNLSLRVGKGVFIPRPETEVVTELALAVLKAIPCETVAVDLCAGSGAISVSLASESPNTKVFAWELNQESRPFLEQNVAGHNVEVFFDDIANDSEQFEKLAGKVDVLISNPPYIPSEAIPRDVEVRLHDPALALYGGEDGMDVMKVVVKRANELLRSGGFVVVEHADDQALIVANLFEAAGFAQVRSHKDLNGKDRAVSAVKR